MFKRISSLVNPYADRLLEYPGLIYACFDFDKDHGDFKTMIFNETSEILIEFGSGSGGHLLDIAKRQPNISCIGFEIRFKRAVRTIEKAQERGLKNVKIFRGKAEFAPSLFEANSVSSIFINFPDPWDKKRWFKHRILTSSVINTFSPLLKKGGYISIKTDHQEYYQSFLDEIEVNDFLQDTNLVIEDQMYNLPKVISIEDNSKRENLMMHYADIESEFEKLFRTQGKEIGYCRLRKIA